MSPDLTSYLLDMISPPPPAGRAICISSLEGFDFSGWADASCTGILTQGIPTEEQAKELNRVLMPGAYLLLVAPEKEPTGHTGTCRIEDAGLEIRDSLLLVQDSDKLHYVPKASRSEREAGCSHLPAKTGAEAVSRKEKTAGLRSPRAGAGRTAAFVHNHHPTIKSVGLLVRLLDGVPAGGLVGDFFAGSGSLGCAVMETGHDAVLGDCEVEYVDIADARVRYWAQVKRPWEEVVVESEHTAAPTASKTFGGLLGWTEGNE